MPGKVADVESPNFWLDETDDITKGPCQQVFDYHGKLMDTLW